MTETDFNGLTTSLLPAVLTGQDIATAIPALLPVLEEIYAANLNSGAITNPTIQTVATDDAAAPPNNQVFETHQSTPLSPYSTPSAPTHRVVPFTVGGVLQILAWEKPPNHDLISDGNGRTFLGKSEMAVMFGQGGVGKTRLATNMAMNQVLQRPVPLFQLSALPFKWLFISNENGMGRLSHDIGRMVRGLDENQIQKVQDGVRFQLLLTPDDDDICLSSNEVRQKLVATLLQEKPDVLVLDPWANVIDGEHIDNNAVRETLQHIRFCLRQAGVPNCVVIVLAHARPGRNNIAQAIGFDAANFGSGAKALLNSARFVINLGPASESDSKKIIVACGKSNNAPPFPTTGLILDPESMFYNLDPTFDLESWKANVTGDRPGSGNSKKTSVKDVCQIVADHDAASVEKAVIAKALETNEGISRSKAYGLVKDAVSTGYLLPTKNGALCLSSKGKNLVLDPGPQSSTPNTPLGGPVGVGSKAASQTKPATT